MKSIEYGWRLENVTDTSYFLIKNVRKTDTNTITCGKLTGLVDKRRRFAVDWRQLIS